MSRRVVAPVLLLLAAACSIAAVFAVHRIESGIGPVSQPSLLPREFSPNGDGVQDTTTVNFTLRERRDVLVSIVDRRDGARVATLLDGPALGQQRLRWDGTGPDGRRVGDGAYEVMIQLEGDPRTYMPTSDLVVDRSAPIGVLDRATLELGELRGLAFLDAGERLEVFTRGSDAPVDAIRQFKVRETAAGAQPMQVTPPEGTIPVRFTVPLDATPERIDVVDRAGNRRAVFPDGDVLYEANG